MTRLSRRTFVAAAGAAALAPAALAAPRRKQAEPLVLNDASRLNPTPVARNVMLRGEDDALIARAARTSEGGGRRRAAGVRRRRAPLDGRTEPDARRFCGLAWRPDRAGYGAAHRARQRRRALARGDRGARSARLLAGGHAIEPRFFRRRHALGQRARLGGAVRAVRRDGEALPADAGGRHRRDLLARGERGAVLRSRSAATGCSGSWSMPSSTWPTTCCSPRGPR